MAGLTQERYLEIFQRYVQGALDQPAAGGGAAATAAEDIIPPAAEPATLSADLLPLPVSVSSSAKKALDKALADAAAKEAVASSGGAEDIKPGTQCKHSGCEQAYSSAASLGAACIYHTGQPVFHEGYKYWSCCPSHKTTEFQVSAPGCCSRLLPVPLPLHLQTMHD